MRFREAAAALNAGVIKMTIYYIIQHIEIESLIGIYFMRFFFFLTWR